MNTRALTQRPAAQTEREADGYGSTDLPWSFTVCRELEPQEKRLMSMLVSAFGPDHPAIDDMAHLILNRPASLPTQPAAQSDEQTIVEICERIGFGRVQQIAGHAWEQKHNCAPRGRMGVTVRNETPAPQQATQQAAGEPVGEVDQIDIDEDGRAHAWVVLHDNVTIGDKLYHRPAPGVPEVDDLRDRLVAISAAVADSDDRAAQAMLGEILRLLAAAQAKGADPEDLAAAGVMLMGRGTDHA